MKTLLPSLIAVLVGCRACGTDENPTQTTSPAESRALAQHHAPSIAGGRPLPFRFPGGNDALDAVKATFKRPSAEERKLVHGPHPLALGAANNTCGTQINLGQDAIKSSESDCSGCAPPDAAIAVGPSDVITATNTAMKIWNKTGTLLSGPTNLATFLAPSGDTLPNFSDPFALYDATADRFIVGMVNYNNADTASTVNVAVTQTSDPTGSWNLYTFTSSPSGDFFDFPHAAINGTTLYVTGNLFQGTTGPFVNARAIAMNLTPMYAGTATTSVTKDVGNNAAGHLADTLIPAANDSASGVMYFLSADNQSTGGSNISVFRWADPFGTNTLALKGGVTVTTYTQPPTPSLDGNPVATNDARNLATFYYSGTLYGAHTVGATAGYGGYHVAGVQWYQIGNIDTTPTLTQQGSNASANPGIDRFFPALALDGSGNMMLGYAYIGPGASEVSVYYQARFSGMASGVLEPETQIVAGTQADPTSRWGDYGSMVFDSGSSQFWYLMEYESSVDSNWSTWMSAIAFNTTAGFDVNVAPDYVAVTDGTNATYTVSSDQCNGYSGTIDLTASGLPGTIPSSFSPTSISGTGTSTLTLSPALSATQGAYAYNITGTDHATGSPSATYQNAGIHVNQPCPFFSSFSPSTITMGQTDTATGSGTVGALFGWNGTGTYSTSGLPAGVTSTWSPTTGGVGSTTTMTLHSSSAAVGTYSFRASVGDSNCTANTGETLVVSAPDILVSDSPNSGSIKRGNSVTSTITVQSLYGFAGTVTLSATGQPSNTTTTFTPASVTLSAGGSANSTMKIQTTTSTPTGTYTVVVKGTSGALQETVNYSLTVTTH